MSTLVVHARDPLAFTPQALYVGRRIMRAKNPIAHVESPWANPYVITDQLDRDASLYLFRRDLNGSDRPRFAWMREHLDELVDRYLTCWCATPGRPLYVDSRTVCHGQILMAAALGTGALS